MPPIIPDAPWWANGLLVLMAVVASVLIVWIPTRKKLNKIDTQVSNHHKTNLRDDLTKVLNAVEGLTTSMDDVKGDVRRIDNRMESLTIDIQDERKERLRHETWSADWKGQYDQKQQAVEHSIMRLEGRDTLGSISVSTPPRPPNKFNFIPPPKERNE